MSSDSNGNNTRIILPSEAAAAETMKAFGSGSDHQEEAGGTAAGSEEHDQPANGTTCADRLPVEDHLVAGQNPAGSGDVTEDQLNSDALTPSVKEVSASSVNGSEVQQDGPAEFCPDHDSSSDSYTLLTPSNGDLSPSPLSTEAPGGAEFVQAEETLLQNQTSSQQNVEELHQGGEDESDEHSKAADLGKQADLSVGSEVGEKKTDKVVVEEPELRKRKSILAAVEEIGRREEDEVEEEVFRPRQQREDDDSGFTVNKCILGAVILLGIGTIFFSESDYEPRDLKDTGKQEWINPEVPLQQADADMSELLNKLNKGDEQILVLQAQHEAEKDELKVAQELAAEGAKEQLQREEMEKENSRLKSEMAAFPALQEENQRMKREMESVPTLQKELEILRSTLNKLKLTSAPVTPPSSLSSDDPQHSRQDQAAPTDRQARKSYHGMNQENDPKWKKHDMGEKREWNERERSERRGSKIEAGGNRDWKRDEKKPYQKREKPDKQKNHNGEGKQWRERDWKDKEDQRRQADERSTWKDKEKKEWMGKNRKHHQDGENERKQVKREKENVGQRHTAKDDKLDWKKGKDHFETYNRNENWKGEKEWRKGKDRPKESGKEKERGWKEKREKDTDTEWKTKYDKGQSDAEKKRGDRKPWEGEDRKVSTWKEEKNQKNEQKWKNKQDNHEREWNQWTNKEKDWKSGGVKEKSYNSHQRKDGSHDRKQAPIASHSHKDQHSHKQAHKQPKPTMEQPEYWVRQRARLHHNPKPPQQCDSMETCAQAETVLPVPFPEFEAILQSYLSKAAQAGVDSSKTEELRKLTTDFFKDGMFVHDQVSFQDFVEDVGDILEDMVEGDEEEDDSDLEEEMEGFQKEMMKRFTVPGMAAREKRVKGEWKRGNGQQHG